MSTPLDSLPLTASASAITFAASAQQVVSSIGSEPQVTAENGVEGQPTDKYVTHSFFGLVEGVALAAFLSAGLSFFLVVGGLVDVASCCVAILAPIVIIQKQGLRNLGGLRGQQNQLRENVKTLKVENTTLSSNVDALTKHVKDVSHVETELQKVASAATSDVDRLVTVVTEQNKVQKEMKDALTRDVVQDIMTAVFQVDRDRDFTMSKEEVQTLRLRLENFPGIVLNSQRFQEFTTTGSDYQDDGKLTLSNILSIARNMQDSSIPEDQRVIQIDPKSLLKQTVA